MPKRMSIPDRWAEKVNCWLWTRSRDKNGYGKFQYPSPSGQVHVRAHRWAYEHFVGPIPDGMQVCHTCDNPPCVNPAHLWLGTNQDNDQDKRNKGRAPSVWGHPLKRSRQTHCKRGHEFTPANTYVTRRGHRRCVECNRVTVRELYWRKKGVA